MKKFLAILSALSLMASAMPMAMASGTEASASNEIVMDMGSDYTTVTWEGSTDTFKKFDDEAAESENAVGGTYYSYNASNDTTTDTVVKVKYQPKAEEVAAGEYEVFVNIPVTARAGVKAAIHHNGKVDNVIYSQYIKANGYLSLGKYDFAADGNEYIELTYGPLNQKGVYDDTTTAYNYIYGSAVFDAVKMVKFEGITEYIEKLVLEENGLAKVNDATEYTADGGYTKLTSVNTIGYHWRTHADVSIHSDSTNFNGGQAYRLNAPSKDTNATNIVLTYYPKLNPGVYKVYSMRAGKQTQMERKVTCSNGSSYTFGNTGSSQSQSKQTVGTMTATGVYGEDYVTIQAYQKSTDASTFFDAIIFEKVDERAGAWSFEDDTTTQTAGTITTWTMEKGSSVNTASDGLNGNAWKIERPTLENDTSSAGNSAIKIPMPTDMQGTYKISMNVWVRSDGNGWYQNIFRILNESTTETTDETTGEVTTTTTRKNLVNLRLENEKLQGYSISKGVDGNARGGQDVDAGNGEWHMATIVYDMRNTGDSSWIDRYSLKYYWDGELISDSKISYSSTSGYPGSLSSATNIYVGADYDGGSRFNGTMDELTIYNEVLTDNEVKILYNKQKRAAAGITDNIKMGNATTLSEENNTIILAAAGVPESDTAFDAASTVNGVFDGDLVYVSSIPEGFYVSNVKAAEDKITVTFAGEAELENDDIIYAAVQAYGTNNASSDRVSAVIDISYDMSVTSGGTITDGKYTAQITNNYYAGETVDVVVAVYETDGRMKDVYLQKNVTVPEAGATFDVESDALNYADGDKVKLFVFDSINTIKPVNISK